ncbi:MAG: threonine/serine dehydratase [Sphingomonadales bacterium]
MKLPTFRDVEAAAARIAGKVTRTPLLNSIELDRQTGGRIYVKPECLQLTGAFKARGAFNRLTAMSEAERARGVVAFSSGNHGQAVAYAAKALGIAATIVMPESAPAIKIEKTRSHGPKIVLYDPETESREEIAAAIAEDTGAGVVPSFEDPYIIAGQGTHALEVIEDAPNLDAYLVCTGGGGLLAGSALVFAELSPETRLYSVEPEEYNDYQKSFETGKRVKNENPKPTICDALMTPSPGVMTFEINRKHVTGGLVVSDDEVRDAIRFAYKTFELVIEPGGAVALAAVLSGKIETRGRAIGLIVTGGNVDPGLFKEILEG